MQSATAVTQTYKAQQQQTQTCKVTLPRQLLPFARIVWTRINKHPVHGATDLVKLAESAASHRHAVGRLELEIHEHGDSDSETRPMFIGTYSMGRLPAFEEGGVYLKFTPTTPEPPHRQAPALGGTLMFTHTTPPPFPVNRQQLGVVYRLMFTHTTPPSPTSSATSCVLRSGAPRPKLFIIIHPKSGPLKSGPLYGQVNAALWPGKRVGILTRDLTDAGGLSP